MKRIFDVFAKLDWTNTTFLLATPVLGIGGLWLWISTGGLPLSHSRSKIFFDRDESRW